MKNILTIIKKEFLRFFKDSRMVLTTLILPGLLIYLIYSFMGDGLTSLFEADDNYIYTVYVYDMPEELNENYFKQLKNFKFVEISENEIENIKTSIEDKQVDCLVVFPKDFMETINSYDSTVSGAVAPNVEIFYNSTKTESQSAYSTVVSLLDTFESTMSNKFNINAGGLQHDLASQKDVTGQMFSMLLPMLIMIFMFSGCMAVAPESIAGEKERGTIATLLVTPIKRSELAIGKILALSVIALLSGISSFLGTILSLPKLYGSSMEGMDISVYNVGDYLMLLGILLSSVLIMISLISIISAYAKSVKEASTLIMPLMIIVMIMGVSSMFASTIADNVFIYFIPLFNSSQAMSGIFSFNANILNVVITIFSNILYSVLLVVILAKMFNSEKIMFSK